MARLRRVPVSKGPENSRLSFSQMGKTNAEQMALAGLADLDRS